MAGFFEGCAPVILFGADAPLRMKAECSVHTLYVGDTHYEAIPYTANSSTDHLIITGFN
ncbi:MAG: hypothetical protein Fur005_41880 [Roseiflexaceae bacterium]